MPWRIICILLFVQNCAADTIRVDVRKLISKQNDLNWSFCPSVSASFNSYKNWLNLSKTSISLLHNLDYRVKRIHPGGWTSNYLFKSEVGYINYPDSIWMKNSDSFKLTLQWNEKQGKILTHTYSFYIKSQFLNTYKYTVKIDSTLDKELKAWFMAPGLIEIAYGFNKIFWEESSLNIAFATCRFDFKPYNASNKDEEAELFRMGRSIVYSEYGFSAQLYIKREFFNKALAWDHQGRYFYKALNKKGIHADVSNRFTIKFLKYMQLKLDSQFIFDPDLGSKGSYKNEFLLGLFYELKQ